MAQPNTNWAGNIAYGAATMHEPSTIAELQTIARHAHKVRALGSRHSFNRIADTDGDLVSVRRLNRIVSLNEKARTVTVEGGITYGELCANLEKSRFAIHNLASLPHIGVVGATATATHGSGNKNGNLSTAVAGLKIVTATGDIVELKRGDADFAGAVVNLGALGIVAEVTLEIQPAFEVRQDLYTELPVSSFIDNFEAISGAAYSVSFFTLWQGDTIQQLWLKNLATAPDAPKGEFFGAKAATRPWHPIASIDPTPCTEQMGVPGPAYLRLPHFRMEFTPSAGAELQSEYFVARRDAVAAFKALHSIQHLIAPVLMVSEIRTMAADDLWMSPNYREDCVAFHFTCKQDWPAVSQVLPRIEAALAPFSVRPHWGKLFTMSAPDIQARYPRLADFQRLVQDFDPTGKFRNAFIEDYIF
jgi:xylitol oxidase